LGAVDNIDARLYAIHKCNLFEKIYLDAGTHEFSANSYFSIPGMPMELPRK